MINGSQKCSKIVEYKAFNKLASHLWQWFQWSWVHPQFWTRAFLRAQEKLPSTCVALQIKCLVCVQYSMLPCMSLSFLHIWKVFIHKERLIATAVQDETTLAQCAANIWHILCNFVATFGSIYCCCFFKALLNYLHEAWMALNSK